MLGLLFSYIAYSVHAKPNVGYLATQQILLVILDRLPSTYIVLLVHRHNVMFNAYSETTKFISSTSK